MIISFTGQYRFLSNFYPAKVSLDGVEYPTVEHAYQAAKCKHRSDREYIRTAETPGDAKRRSRRVEIRREWDVMRIPVMRLLLRQKFNQEPLRTKLLETNNDELIEGNTWGDTFWGVCNRKGENHLGKLLMEIRSDL